MDKAPDNFPNRISQALADYRAAYVPQPVTPERIQQAAPGLAQFLWRNTAVVETGLHAGEGLWTDRDMLRVNTRATALCRDTLAEIDPEVKGDHVPATAVRRCLLRLSRSLSAIIPDSHMLLRQELATETSETIDNLSESCATTGWDF